MNDDKLLQYIIKRFDALENKVDKLVEFRWFLLGIAAGVSCIISFLVHLLK